MAQERQPTPENQLLNLIESKKSDNPDLKVQAAKHKSMSMVSPGAWRGRLSFIRDSVRKQVASGGVTHYLDIKTVNNLLLISVIALGFYLAFNVYSSVAGFRKIPRMEISAQEGAKQLPDIRGISLLKQSASYYLGVMENRDIFKMRGKKTQESAEPLYKPPTSKITEVVSHLKLVGISFSNDPDAMIEDTQAMRTFFVKRGGMVGNVKVQAIFRDKIILSYEGEEAELR